MSTTEADIRLQRDETLHHMGECESTCLVCHNGEPCLGCGELTLGSIGASGLRWRRVCQPCKDEADNAAAAHVKGFGQAVRMIDEELKL